MARVILVRHGETDQNRDDILQGRMDTDLNRRGVEQAGRIAERLEGEDIDAVYSSSMRRATRTGEIIAGRHAVDLKELSELEERGYGLLEGEGKEEMDRLVRERQVSYDALAPEGGETLQNVSQRAFPVLQEIRRKHDGETVVVVGHGDVNRSLLLTALGADSGHGHRFSQDNGCINELEYDPTRGWRINRVNDTSHLN